jgi:hypothetical protein
MPQVPFELRVLGREESVRHRRMLPRIPVDVQVIPPHEQEPIREGSGCRPSAATLNYRLAVLLKSRCPPLRDRRDDIPLLAGHIFVEILSPPPGRLRPRTFAKSLPKTFASAGAYHWARQRAGACVTSSRGPYPERSQITLSFAVPAFTCRPRVAESPLATTP